MRPCLYSTNIRLQLADWYLAKRKLRPQKHREEEREFNRRRKERGGRKGEKERETERKNSEREKENTDSFPFRCSLLRELSRLFLQYFSYCIFINLESAKNMYIYLTKCYFSGRIWITLWINLPTSAGSLKTQESSRNISTSALLTMPNSLTVWITTKCGKRGGNIRPPDLPLEKPVCRSGSNS